MLVSRSVSGALEVETVCPVKLRLVVDKLTTGGRPVPLSDTDWGLLTALSQKYSAPIRLPPAVGVKVTLTVQLAPAATELPQLLV